MERLGRVLRHLAFAKQAGARTAWCSDDPRPLRELKQCVLVVQYGMEAQSLALRITQPPIVARDLLRADRETNRQFWPGRMPRSTKRCWWE